MAAVETIVVSEEEGGMRLDRWFKAHYPGLSFVQLQKLLRSGQVRLDGKRAEASDRISYGQAIRVPPLATDAKTAPKRDLVPGANEADATFIRSIIIYEDDDVLVLNKPAGLAVQGGSGLTKHVDKMLESLADRHGNVPRLVHRIDRETSGCLVVAKRKAIAGKLTAAFRSREAKKTYWALVAGVPKPAQGRISTYLAKGEDEKGDDKMHVARHGDDGASHAVTYYAIVDQAGQQLSWLSMKPVTGRTHQLRAHAAHIGHPIVGDPKYFNKQNWDLPGGMQNRLHLLARRIIIPHPKGGMLDVTAPLPQHMQQSWNLLGFDASEYDPTEDLETE